MVSPEYKKQMDRKPFFAVILYEGYHQYKAVQPPVFQEGRSRMLTLWELERMVDKP